jgi:hypothetical protein
VVFRMAHRWKTVLERWVDRVRDLGVGMVSVVDRDVSVPTRFSAWWSGRRGGRPDPRHIHGIYAELDLTDLVHFHHEGGHRSPGSLIRKVHWVSACWTAEPFYERS